MESIIRPLVNTRYSNIGARIGWYVTPFVEGSYLFDQKGADDPDATDKTWNTLTGRAGVQLKAEF